MYFYYYLKDFSAKYILAGKLLVSCLNRHTKSCSLCSMLLFSYFVSFASLLTLKLVLICIFGNLQILIETDWLLVFILDSLFPQGLVFAKSKIDSYQYYLEQWNAAWVRLRVSDFERTFFVLLRNSEIATFHIFMYISTCANITLSLSNTHRLSVSLNFLILQHQDVNTCKSSAGHLNIMCDVILAILYFLNSSIPKKKNIKKK